METFFIRFNSIIFLYFLRNFLDIKNLDIDIYFDKFYNSIIYFEVLSNRQTEYLLDILNGFLELAKEQEQSVSTDKAFLPIGQSPQPLCSQSKMLGTILTILLSPST